MEGTYPVILDNQLIGQMTVSRRGLLTCFTVQCVFQKELLRVSVYGKDHTEGYLGVLAPDGEGGLRLERRLSRHELEFFPAEPDHCGRAGEAWEEERESVHTPETAAEDVLWHTGVGGVLITEQNGRNLVAVPADREGIPLEKAVEVREIDGVRRAVFEVKDGNML